MGVAGEVIFGGDIYKALTSADSYPVTLNETGSYFIAKNSAPGLISITVKCADGNIIIPLDANETCTLKFNEISEIDVTGDISGFNIYIGR